MNLVGYIMRTGLVGCTLRNRLIRLSMSWIIRTWHMPSLGMILRSMTSPIRIRTARSDNHLAEKNDHNSLDGHWHGMVIHSDGLIKMNLDH